MRNIATPRSSDWTDTDTATNDTATATKAAPKEGLRHFVTHVAGGYDASKIGTLTLKAGSTTLMVWHVHDSLAIDFNSPIEIPAGTAANLELSAGGMSNDGTASMAGYTV